MKNLFPLTRSEQPSLAEANEEHYHQHSTKAK